MLANWAKKWWGMTCRWLRLITRSASCSSAREAGQVAGSGAAERFAYAKGRHSLMRGTMVAWTWPSLPSLRFCLELLLEARWRRPALRRRILPVAVIFNRLEADFFVLRRAMDRGMGRAN